MLADALKSFAENPTLATLGVLIVIGLITTVTTLIKRHLARVDRDERRSEELNEHLTEVLEAQIVQLRADLKERDLDVEDKDRTIIEQARAIASEHEKYKAMLEKRIADQDLFLRALEEIALEIVGPAEDLDALFPEEDTDVHELAAALGEIALRQHDTEPPPDAA